MLKNRVRKTTVLGKPLETPPIWVDAPLYSGTNHTPGIGYLRTIHPVKKR